MEARTYALDPALGMLVGCEEGCGKKGRMMMVKEPTEAYKAKFECTYCGEVRYMSYKTWVPFLSFHISK